MVALVSYMLHYRKATIATVLLNGSCCFLLTKWSSGGCLGGTATALKLAAFINAYVAIPVHWHHEIFLSLNFLVCANFHICQIEPMPTANFSKHNYARNFPWLFLPFSSYEERFTPGQNTLQLLIRCFIILRTQSLHAWACVMCRLMLVHTLDELHCINNKHWKG